MSAYPAPPPGGGAYPSGGPFPGAKVVEQRQDARGIFRPVLPPGAPPPRIEVPKPGAPARQATPTPKISGQASKSVPGSSRRSGGTSPDEGGSASPAHSMLRCPWISDEYHPRHYYHRFQLESMSGQLSTAWSFDKQTRWEIYRKLRIVGKKMRLPYRTIYTTELLYNRFYATFPPRQGQDYKAIPSDVGQTAFLLATKTEETMKKSRELITELLRLDRAEGRATGEESTAQEIQALVEQKKPVFQECEQQILEVVGFEFHSHQPQKFVIKYAKHLAAKECVDQAGAKELARRAWMAIPEMNKCTELNVRFSPERLAMAALLIASRTDLVREPAAEEPLRTGSAIPVSHKPQFDHWLDHLPGIGFQIPEKSGSDTTRKKHGRALVYEAAIDALDALAEFYLSNGREELAHRLMDVAYDIRGDAGASWFTHPFSGMWPKWEMERRKLEHKERVCTARLPWSK
ncbi:hypothetical protein DFJ74DRAFT_649812 [Hyaloraphidium curvatum]|nr:hypothetical protein DFJ74DRAFT_649812 [Hyaloraphidium curvatum]